MPRVTDWARHWLRHGYLLMVASLDLERYQWDDGCGQGSRPGLGIGGGTSYGTGLGVGHYGGSSYGGGFGFGYGDGNGFGYGFNHHGGDRG